jgi:hypothetical protein
MTDFDLSHLTWRKSSYSGGNGGNCVEIAPARRKSGRNGGNGGGCIEVASVQRVIAVRDSKDSSGSVLTFTPQVWRAFTISVRTGRCEITTRGATVRAASQGR